MILDIIHMNELQDAARSNLILECIVTWESKIEIGLKLMNQACYFCPHIFALSTNSLGRKTYRLQSFRTKVFDKFPRTGLPEYFESVASYDNFETLW
jgi:carboxylate-amine ligase